MLYLNATRFMNSVTEILTNPWSSGLTCRLDGRAGFHRWRLGDVCSRRRRRDGRRGGPEGRGLLVGHERTLQPPWDTETTWIRPTVVFLFQVCGDLTSFGRRRRVVGLEALLPLFENVSGVKWSLRNQGFGLLWVEITMKKSWLNNTGSCLNSR